MAVQTDPLDAYEFETDFDIDEDALQKAIDLLESQTPAQIAQTNIELKAQRRKQELEARRAARASLPLGAQISPPSNVPTPSSFARALGMPGTYAAAMNKMVALRDKINADYGNDNLAIVCNIDRKKVRGDFNLMAINLWGLLVMEGTDFIPEDDDMLDTDLFDSTIKSLFDNCLVMESMVDSLEAHLHNKFKHAEVDGKILTYPENSRFAHKGKRPDNTPSTRTADEPDSVIHPDWASW